MRAASSDPEPFDAAVHLDRYLVEEQVERLADTAEAARSTWEQLRRSSRPASWEGDDDLFEPGLVDELHTLIFEALQTAEIAWKLIDEANLDYYRRLEVHEAALEAEE